MWRMKQNNVEYWLLNWNSLASRVQPSLMLEGGVDMHHNCKVEQFDSLSILLDRELLHFALRLKTGAILGYTFSISYTSY